MASVSEVSAAKGEQIKCSVSGVRSGVRFGVKLW